MEVCEDVHSETGALTINGSATNIRVLEDAGAGKADVILCLLRDAGDNIACALLAKSLGISRIIARLRNPIYEEAYRLAGVTTIVRLSDLVVNQIMMEVEQPKVKKIITVGGGKAEIYAVKIPEGSRSVGMTIKEIDEDRNFPKECVFIGIYNIDNGDFLIPRGSHSIQDKDTVFLLSKTQYIRQAADFLIRAR
ncbi:MAG: TrkA family potassium uptake protein, partial [Candidatus Krumholzibacteria bacterium]|nr:TrkA family potassium uptake protein [Candidatus Krumholzibacteria bacterium]